jgi:hypothetical protein
MKEKTDVRQGTLALMVLKTVDVLGPLHGYGIARRIEQISGDLLAVRLGWQRIFLVFGYRFGFYRCERTSWQPRCWSADTGTLPQQLAEGTEQSSLALTRAVAQGSPLHNIQTEGTAPAGQAWPRTDSTGIGCRSRDDTALRVPLR